MALRNRDGAEKSRNLIKPMDDAVFKKAKTGCRIPYRTCRLWWLLGSFLQHAMEKYAKSITFMDKSYRSFCVFVKRENLIKPIENAVFKKEKSVAKYFIKPVVYDDFRYHFHKMLWESMQKALRL